MGEVNTIEDLMLEEDIFIDSEATVDDMMTAEHLNEEFQDLLRERGLDPQTTQLEVAQNGY